MAVTDAAYQELLLSLLPSGAAWPRDLNTDLARILAGLAVELARVDARAAAIVEEADPRDTSEMLTDWERLYEIIPADGASTEQRLALVLFRFLQVGDIKKPALVELASAMGYTIRIDDYVESMPGWFSAGDELLENPWVYLSAGIGMAGDTLAFEDVVLPWIWEVVVLAAPASAPTPDLEAVLTDLKPEHVWLNFTYL